MAHPHDPAAAMHDDEVAVDVDTVRRLVADQFPEWAHLSVRRVASAGTVNAIFRIGAELGARSPLRLIDPDAARAWLAREARAQAEFARVSPFPTPAPERIGTPGHGYPMPFTVQSWVAGRAPGVGEFVDRSAWPTTWPASSIRSEPHQHESRAWAFVQAIGLVLHYVRTTREMHGLKVRTLQEILSPRPE